MNWEALIAKALGGQVMAYRYDKAHNDFDVQVHYPNPDPVIWNWTLIRRIDFENHRVYGRVSLAQLTHFIENPEKEIKEALKK